MKKLISSRRRKVMSRLLERVYEPFIIDIKTANISTGSSDSLQFKLPIIENSTINIKVDWGDGVINQITSTNDPNIKHTYSMIGNYQVSITGNMNGFSFNNNGDKEKLERVVQWGSFKFTGADTFYGCKNLNFDTTAGIPKIATNTLQNTFRDCGLIVSFDGTGWNVSGVEDFSIMFAMVSVTSVMTNWSAPSWDMSSATNIFAMFYGTTECTNFDLANWDVSNVENMNSLWFNNNSLVNLDIDGWITSSATSIASMFNNCTNLATIQWSNFDTSNVTSMGTTFFGCKNLSDPLLQDVEVWDVSKAIFISGIFRETDFIKFDMSQWNVSNVQRASFAFQDATISNFTPGNLQWNSLAFANSFFYGANGIVNLDLSTWQTSENLVNLESTFREMDNLETLNVTGWNTSKVRSTFTLTYACRKLVNLIGFNTWDVTSMLDARWIFAERPTGNLVDMDLSNWRFDSLQQADLMFKNNRALRSINCNGWGMANVTSMAQTFDTADFCVDTNGVETWDVSNVTNMKDMFINNKQNSGINVQNWDVGNVTRMDRMLYDCDQFNQNLGSWSIERVSNFNGFLQVATGFSNSNYDLTLIGWENTLQTAYPNGVGYTPTININFDSAQYSIESADARQRLIDDFGWTIIDGGITASPKFIIQVKTDNSGTSADNQFTLPWIGTYDVDWGDGTSDSSVTNTQTHTYASAGTYDVKVIAASGRISFNNGGDKSKLLDIRNWGTCQWTSMEFAFQGSGNLDNISAVDIINLTNCTSLRAMFRNSSVSQINTSNWDVSNITSLYQTFAFCSNIQSLDVSSWDVSNVIAMESLFRGMTAINTLDVSSWDTSNLGISPSAARFVFMDSPNINPDISNWVLGSNNLDKMLEDADSFDRSLANWDISSTPNLINFMQNASGMSTANYNATLISWASQNPTPTSCNFGNSQYTLGGAAESARNTLINTFGWTIVDGGGI